MAEADEGARAKRRCVTRKNAVPSAVHYVGYVEDEETPDMIMKKFEELERVMHGAKASFAAAVGPSSASAIQSKESLDLVPNGTATVCESGSCVGVTLCEGNVGQGDGADDVELNDEQLMMVFMQTSTFNIKAALANNDVLYGGVEGEDSGAADPGADGDLLDAEDLEDFEYLQGFWSDDDCLEGPDGRSGKSGRGRSAVRGSNNLRGDRVPRVPGAAREQKSKHQVRGCDNKMGDSSVASMPPTQPVA